MPGDSRGLRVTAGLFTSLIALCLGPGRLSSQTPEQRRAIDAFRDSLQIITDSTVLQVREAQLLLAAQHAKKDAFLHLRLGQLALRQGELGDASHYDDAASEFNWAADLAPHWPYAWFGLGLAEYALGRRAGAPREPRSGRGREAWSRASQAFARASVLEPAFAVRLEDLARQAMRESDAPRAAVIREALRRAAEQRGARVLLALGRVQRELGDTTALSSFTSYLATDENRPLGELELGRTELLNGNLRGFTTYLSGAAEEDPVALAEYRSDILPLASDAELAEFDLSRGTGRAQILRRFWSLRDRLELRREGERLAEHLRRLTVARREFVILGDENVERLDDRGRIYIRHGEPADRASFAIPGVEPNESWRYHRSGGDLVLHFVARQSPNDFRLVESVLDVAGAGIATAPIESASAGPALDPGRVSTDQLLRSRTPLAPVYGEARSASRERAAALLSQERALGRRGIQIGNGSDSYPLRFEQSLDAWGSLLVAGGSGAQPALQVVFSIPGYAIEPASGVAGVVYPVRVRFIALDLAGEVVAAVDTITPIALTDRVPPNRSLVGRIAVPVRPGLLLAHAAVQYGDQAGTVFDVDSVMVPSPGGGELALGDLLLGDPRGRLTVPIGEHAQLSFSPGGLVRRSEGAALGIEVFGLEPGSPAKLRVLVAPVDSMSAAGAEPRWREFPDSRGIATLTRSVGSGAIVSWQSWLPLTKLKAGSWLLAVEVTDSKGREVRRETPLVVQTP